MSFFIMPVAGTKREIEKKTFLNMRALKGALN